MRERVEGMHNLCGGGEGDEGGGHLQIQCLVGDAAVLARYAVRFPLNLAANVLKVVEFLSPFLKEGGMMGRRHDV